MGTSQELTDSSQIKEMLMALETPKGQQGILSLQGNAAASFLALVFTLCATLQVSTSKSLSNAQRPMQILPYREIVKLFQRSGGIPPIVCLDSGSLEVVEKGGEGAYGSIYFGRYDGKEVAIKFPLRHYSRRAVLKESAFGLFLHHPHILRSFGLANMLSPKRFCIITPRMAYGNIRQYVEETQEDLRDIIRLITEIADGLLYLHSSNVVHADLRVPNILVDKDGHARISDFGKSGFNGSTAASSRPELIGAVGYLAPELLAPEDFGHDLLAIPTLKSDIYAFGSACYEMLAGEPPFGGIPDIPASLSVVRGRRSNRPPNTPDGLWALITSCWNQQSSRRPDAQDVFDRAQALALSLEH